MKSGIDYFPLDVHLDDKFKLIEAEFGLTGFAVVVKIFQRIYGDRGYYCEWTNEVALLFARECGLGGSVVSEIVSAAIKRGIFDKALFEEYGILTSKGIQTRYFEAVSRRVNVTVENQYLLVPYAPARKNVDISSKNVYRNEKNVYRNEQSKVDKKRVNKSRLNKSKEDDEARTRAETSPSLFIAPTLEMVRDYIYEKGYSVKAERFYDYYRKRRWRGSNGDVLLDWREALDGWEANDIEDRGECDLDDI